MVGRFLDEIEGLLPVRYLPGDLPADHRDALHERASRTTVYEGYDNPVGVGGSATHG